MLAMQPWPPLPLPWPKLRLRVENPISTEILLPRLAFHLSRNAKELNGVRKFSSTVTIS
jgi:hypothetical protein